MGSLNFNKISQNFILYLTTLDIMLHGSLIFLAVILICCLITTNDCWTTGWTCILCFGPFVYFLSQMTISICLTKEIKNKENNDDAHNNRLRVFSLVLISTAFLPLVMKKIPSKAMEYESIVYAGIIYLVWKIFLGIFVYIYSNSEKRELCEYQNESSERYSLCARVLRILLLLFGYIHGLVHAVFLSILILLILISMEDVKQREKIPGIYTYIVGNPDDIYQSMMYFGTGIFFTSQLLLAVYLVNSMDKMRNGKDLKIWAFITASFGILPFILTIGVDAPDNQRTNHIFFLFGLVHIIWKGILTLSLFIYLRERKRKENLRNVCTYDVDVTSEIDVNEACPMKSMENNCH